MQRDLTDIVTGMLRRSRDEHPQSRTCPGCGADLQRVALIAVAYIWTGCECRVAIDYDHLYEQLWHIECLRKSEAPVR
ncbi:MAG: hypothetical protein KF809_17230 [Chloroflexi bacterium]|nr:hypothetical protein [Chloroflexota bacterium]